MPFSPLNIKIHIMKMHRSYFCFPKNLIICAVHLLPQSRCTCNMSKHSSSVKHCRTSNMHINQRLQTLFQIIFIAIFHHIYITVMINISEQQINQMVQRMGIKDDHLIYTEQFFNHTASQLR